MYQIIFLKDHFKMIIPFVDLKQRYIDENKDLNKVINRVLASGNLIGSNDVLTFEQNICTLLGQKYCVSLNSGTDALMMALHALGIGKGDEVITTPLSFIATVGAIVHVGAKPIFVDVDESLNIDANLIEKAITKKTKAIIPVHWTGRMCDMKKISKIAKNNKLYVIEDAAQAIGSTFNGSKPGKFSDVATFSAHPLKILNAVGDGGFLVSNNKKLCEFINKYKNHGLVGRDNVEIFGINSRLDAVNAGILNFRLKKLNKIIKTRQKNIDLYKKLIKVDNFSIIDEYNNSINSNTMFVALCEKRDDLNNFLRSKGIESLIYYGKALHQHDAYLKNFGKENYPVAEDLVKKVISLPFHQYLSNKEIIHVANNVNKFYV